MRYLSAADLDAALPIDAAIDAMAAVFDDLPATTIPERIFMRQPRLSGSEAWLGVMPAGWRDRGLGAKVVSLIEDNPRHGRPTIQGVAVLLDPETGAPSLITDAARLTTRRTAAMAGLATHMLAPADARHVALIGTGALADDMVAAMRAVRDVQEVRLFNRSPGKAAAAATRLGPEAVVADSAESAADGADIVLLCTTAREPVIADRALQGRVHVNAVGNYSPEGSELELDSLARAEIWVDTYEGALAEAGEILGAIQAGRIAPQREGIRGDLRALCGGRRPAPEAMLTVFKSVGTAAADVGAMVAAAAAATRLGVGIELPT